MVPITRRLPLTKGKGSFLNDRRIRVSKRNALNSCIFSIHNDITLNSNLNNKKDYEIIKDLVFQNSLVIREFGSSALSFAWLASGKIDCFLSNNLNMNEVACGELLIKEAGGYISNLKSVSPNQVFGEALIAANPVIHREILKKYKLLNNKSK